MLEVEKKILDSFCTTIDEKGEGYLPYLFEDNSYMLIRKAEEF